MRFPISQVNIAGSLESDPGVNLNAALTGQFTAGMDKRRIFNWLMGKQLTKKFGENAIPLSELTSKAQPLINNGLGDFINMFESDASRNDGYAQFQNFIGIADDAFKLKDNYGVNIPREQELRDVYAVIRTVQKDSRGNYYIPDMQNMLNFLSQQKMYQGSRITITNTYIQVNNNRFTNANPALFRTLVRAGYYGRGYIPGNVPLN